MVFGCISPTSDREPRTHGPIEEAVYPKPQELTTPGSWILLFGAPGDLALFLPSVDKSEALEDFQVYRTSPNENGGIIPRAQKMSLQAHLLPLWQLIVSFLEKFLGILGAAIKLYIYTGSSKRCAFDFRWGILFTRVQPEGCQDRPGQPV